MRAYPLSTSPFKTASNNSIAPPAAIAAISYPPLANGVVKSPPSPPSLEADSFFIRAMCSLV